MSRNFEDSMSHVANAGHKSFLNLPIPLTDAKSEIKRSRLFKTPLVVSDTIATLSYGVTGFFGE
jgi:hypothetical protein